MKQALIVVILILPANAFAAEPMIRLPMDGERIGAQITDLCPSEKEPCRRAHAEGWVPDDLIGVFAVEPLNASPNVWIQPFASIPGGDVRATIYLGDPKEGAKEHYRIYLLACKADHGLRTGTQTTLEEVQTVCVWSKPVTVYRER